MLKTPPLQTATATIDTLCGRLHSATLLEDRRAAILGLRSFAKQYPASVASGSLRELIAILRRDGLGQQSSADEDKDGRQRQQEGTGDVDTIRLVLETLLMLFNPDSGSPEAGDEIAFFMADEFSMRQDNIALLLNLLDPTSPYADYYARLYSLQILSAICLARPERLQECILSAPLGISRLVGMLDDTRDAVRNAGLLLLVDLTSGASEDLRKIVAFEDVFAKSFGLIRLEGGLAEAGITAQDCLTLLANLVTSSGSIQNMFRESGCVSLLAELLTQVFPASTPEATFIAQSREKSAFGLLQLLRFFFVPGESSTPQNQVAFFRAGTAQILIDIGFSPDLPTPIRIASLRCATELIANNPPLQEAFAAMTVVSSAPSETSSSPAQQVNGTRPAGPSAKKIAGSRADKPRTYIIEALLDLTLDQKGAETTLRAVGCGLIQAYLAGHDRIRAHFLQRAITGHAQNEAAANVLSTILHPDADSRGLLFASWIVQDLILGNHDAKSALAAVKEGDENEGEDVLSFIQAIGSLLEDTMAKAIDAMAVSAYASLLIVFLWEYASGVDDFLSESSSLLQALASMPRAATPSALRYGLSAALLGTVYEFSTKDSPIPRRSIAPLLMQKLTRAKYLDALADLRRSPAVKDFDLQERDEDDQVFSNTFIDLFTVEYSRLRKAVDKDPGLEVLPPSATEAGVDRDVLDDLRQQLQTAKEALTQAQSENLATTQKHEQDMLSAGKDLQSVQAEVERLRRINQAMQQGHETELAEQATKYDQERQGLLTTHERALNDAKQSNNTRVQAAVQEREKAFAERVQDYERRLAELGNTHRSEQNEHASTRQHLEAMTARHSDIAAKEKQASEQVTELNTRYNRLDREHQTLQSSSSQSSSALEQLKKELEQRQMEAERLQSQAKELQEELRGREDELATERAGFADLEKELEAAKSATTATSQPTDFADLELQLKEAKEAEKSAKEELESMLLVMGDIESKRDLYRGKVKELGGEVSEDEDDAEEEEDEDEDEDEVD